MFSIEKVSTLTPSIIEQRCVHEGLPLVVSEALTSKSLRALLTSAQQESGTAHSAAAGIVTAEARRPLPVIVNALKAQLKPWLAWRADEDDLLAHLPADAEPQPVAQLMLPEGMHPHEDVRGAMWMHVLLGPLDNVPKRSSSIEWVVIPAASKTDSVVYRSAA